MHMVVEVLSTSTEGIDRREKLIAYRGIPSLQEYVLVAQDEAKIEIHRRHGDIGWEIVTLTPGDPVELKSVELLSDFPAGYEETGLVAGGALPPADAGARACLFLAAVNMPDGFEAGFARPDALAVGMMANFCFRNIRKPGTG